MNQREVVRKLKSAFLHRFSRSIASSLVLVLFMIALATPVEAEWTDLSGSLPGTMSTGGSIGIAAAGAVAIGLVVYFGFVHKGHPPLKLETKSIRFDDLTPASQPRRPFR